jgi:thiosulfate dehydrogenase
VPHASSLKLVLAIGMVACSLERRDPARPSAGPAPGSTADGATAAALRFPADSEIPQGPLGASIRRGRAILVATNDSLPEYVGNALTCTNCHQDAGTRANSSPWVGVYTQFPQYRSRNARINLIEDRINDCFRRSMNGKALPIDHLAMLDMIAYFSFLSWRVPPATPVAGQGYPRLTPLEPDSTRGKAVYEATCAVCHGADGAGTVGGPPVWGNRSYTIGAGMARVRTAAAFIRYNMPMDQPGTLTDQQSFDVAAYMNSRPRPDFAGKENDWPNGDPPPDVAYPTHAAAAKAASRRTP